MDIQKIEDLLYTLQEASLYIQNELTEKGCLEGQQIGQDICDAVTNINGILGNPEELTSILKAMLEHGESVNKNFLEKFDEWRLLAPTYVDHFASTSITVYNHVDSAFSELFKEIHSLPYDTVLYRIKKAFSKLAKPNQTNLSDYFSKYQFWGSLEPQKNNYQVFENRAFSLKEHLEDFCWFYNKLEDYRSKKTLYAILNNWYRFDFETLAQVKETNYKDYFDLDIFACDENEVFLDLGAYIGDTIMDYMQTYNQAYKRIYCYEITPATMQVLQNNLSAYKNIIFRQKGAFSTRGTMFIDANINSTSANILGKSGQIEVETVPIDEDIQDDLTFIKMDIEGAEQNALLGCKKHIQNSHPKLAICLYHNCEDIWKIPRMIQEIDPTYKFYLRHNGGNLIPTEYVLLAV